MRDKILQAVIGITAQKLGKKADEVKEEDRFIEDLGADSLDTTEIVMAIEEKFKSADGSALEVPNEVADRLTTVGAVADYLLDIGVTLPDDDGPPLVFV